MGADRSPEEQDAQDLFPHSRLCIQRMQHIGVIHGKPFVCTCKADARRRSFLYLLKRMKRRAYIDAYARIRYRAAVKAEAAKTPMERQAFEEVASWAEALEFGHLEE